MIVKFKEIFRMSITQIERLKKDIREATYYQRRLTKKGKNTLAYKMEKKIQYMSNCLNDTVEEILMESR